MKFQIGDIIIGTDPVFYRITSTNMLRGEVIAVRDGSFEDIEVRVLEHEKNPAWNSTRHWVNSNYFEFSDQPNNITITPAELFALLNVKEG